jgi:hypothetical protein
LATKNKGEVRPKTMKKAVLDALRTYGSEVHLRSTAPDPDLHAGRIQIFHVLALDISDLAAEKTKGRRALQRLRADDRLFEIVKKALISHVPGCKEARTDIQQRAKNATGLNGKAVWTEQFLERFAPIILSTPESISCDMGKVPARGRLSNNRDSDLHHVVLEEAKLQMFRDGTLVFTLKTSFDERVAGINGPHPPASVPAIIDRLAELDSVATAAFHCALDDFLRPAETRQRLSTTLVEEGYEDIELLDRALDRDLLRRKAEKHTVIVIERFYTNDVADLDTVNPAEDGTQNRIVPLHTVLASSSLAGILNTASWFHSYNSRYVSRLIDKEIGYRDDEIYITDRKATVVSAAGIWDNKDSLSHYIKDVVLTVEYNIALLAYFASTLAYYQEHQDVRSLEQAKPLDALRQVTDGRAILSQMVESLDLTILVDHGFTRLFVERLRAELGFKTAVQFIRQRVEDASTGVGLRSSVDAAENTSKKSLKAAHQNRRWAIIGVFVALALGIGGFYAGRQNDVQLHVEPGVCVHSGSEGPTALACPTSRIRAQSPSP